MPIVETPEGCLTIQWVPQGAKVVVPKGVYQVSLEELSDAGLWEPVRVQHLTGNGGTVTFPILGRPRKADFVVRAFTSNKFATTAATAAPTPFQVHNPELDLQISVPEPANEPSANAAPSATRTLPIMRGKGLQVSTALQGNRQRFAGSTIPFEGPPAFHKVPVTSKPAPITSTGGVLPIFDTGDLTLGSIITGIAAPTFTITTGTAVTGNVFTLAGTATGNNMITTTAATSGATTLSTATAFTSAMSSAVSLAASVDGSLAAPIAVESDIWKFAGDRLFYFNQFRGLQVIDIHDPAKPCKLGTLRVPAVGDQLQLLDSEGRYLALFTRQADNAWQTQIHIVAIAENGHPRLVKTLPFGGYMGETRLIGKRLYVLFSGWWNENGRQVTLRLQGYDLTDPTAPVDLGYASGVGNQPVLQDAGDHLLISASDPTDGNRCLVHAVNVSDNGRPRLVKTVTLTGYMHDQFKMSIVGGSIVTVSEVRRKWVYGPQTTTTTGNQVSVSYSYTIYPSHTWVESFALAGDSTVAQARVHLDDAAGEQLYAVRFGGKRLYVVTYGVKQTEPQTFSSSYTYVEHGPCDPLFVIDLDDPANPVVRGQLAIPGWSTFMEVAGDRLLSVGRESNTVAASLFDVSDADRPALLSRVYPGQRDGYWTQSESETEHRAVTWLRDQHKFFVPYQVWGSNGPISASQEVNYTDAALTLGDVVHTAATTRRGTSINGFLLAISGRELVVATDAEAGATSTEVARLELAWPVDRIVPVGDYLIEIETLGAPTQYEWGWNWPSVGNYSNSGSRANNRIVLRLTTRQDPETILDSVELAGDQSTIVGTSVHGGKLYLAQWLRDWCDQTPQLRTYVVKPQGNEIRQTGSATTILPLAEVLNTGSVKFDAVQALWLSDDQLVWYIPCGARLNDYCYRWVYGWQAPHDCPTPEVEAIRRREAAGWGHGICALLCPLSIAGPAIETTAEPLKVYSAPRDSILVSTSRAYTDNGLLFFSSTQKVPDDGFDHDAEMQRDGEFASSHDDEGVSTTLLHVVKFGRLGKLRERDVTALPGPLLGASSADEQGSWLLSSRPDRLLSLAYDGVMVRRRDRLNISNPLIDGSDSRNGLLFSPSDNGVQPFRQNQNTGKLEKLTAWVTGPKTDTLRISGKALIISGYQSLGVARINANQTLTPLVTKSWAGYSSQLLSARAAIDPQGTGVWVPAAEYGLEWLGFSNTEPALAASVDD